MWCAIATADKYISHKHIMHMAYRSYATNKNET